MVALTPARLKKIRTAMNLSQERMASLLGVSFTSVNRWEAGGSSPIGATVDLYRALDAALETGVPAKKLTAAADHDRATFLYLLFDLAYGKKVRAS
jgi:type I restriction enzyme M protein